MIRPATEDKLGCCREGEAFEHEFIAKYGERLGVSLNPEKLDNPYPPDLVDANGLADLKTQTQPFYSAGKSYGIDPMYCVTFNRKDGVRYWNLYRDLTIYFWVRWAGDTQYKVTVPKFEAVYMIPFPALALMLKDAPLHAYKKRIHDTVNAKESYLLDTRSMKLLESS